MALLDSLKFGSEMEPEIEAESPIEFAQDPEPGQAPPRRGRPPKRAPDAGNMSQLQVKRLAKSVASDLGGLLDLGGTLWEMSGDECCAPILQRQSKPIGEALAGCLERNPQLLAKFANVDFVSMTLQLGMLGKAVQPVLNAVWANHVSGAHHGEVENDGRAGIDLSVFPTYAA